MKSSHRTAIYRWLLGLGVLVAVGLLWPDVTSLDMFGWLTLGSISLLVLAMVQLRINLGMGSVSFVPVAAMIAYLTVGINPALLSVTVGLLVGQGIQIALQQRSDEVNYEWWQLIGQLLWPIGRTGASLLIADQVYLIFEAGPPLTQINDLSALLPIAISPLMFVLAYDLLLAADLRLQGKHLQDITTSDLREMMAMHLVPLVPAPFAAIANAQIGVLAFFLFEIMLLVMAIVIKRLTITQERLTDQVDQLRTLSSMNRAMRTSLEVDSLVQSAYLQIVRLLKVKNFMVVLEHGTGSARTWKTRFVAKNGQRLEEPAAQPIDGLTRWVLEEHVPLLASSVPDTARERNIKDPPSSRTWMGIPLRTSDRVIGALTVWLNTGQQPDRTFDELDMNTLKTVSAQTEIALENALLYRETEKHAAQLARLNEISTMLNASLNPEQLLELIASSVIEVAGCDKAAIYLADEESGSQRLLLTNAQGFSPEHIVRSKDIAVPLTKDEREQVLGKGAPIAVPDLKAEGATVSAAAMVLAEHEDFTAYAYLPLRAQARMIGMLAVYYDAPHDFSGSEMELLDTFANQAALAVVNARIYQQVDIQLTRRVGQMVKMSDISQRLSATLDLDTIFNLIIDSALEGCNADAGVLVLSGDPVMASQQAEDEHSNEPHMVAWRGFDPSSNLRAPHRVAEDVAQSEVMADGETRIRSVDDPNNVGPYSQLCVPIFLENKVIGAIALESAMLNAFTHEDLSFVSQLAVQASVAIKNAQLYRHAQTVRDRLHAILDASSEGLLMFDNKMRIVMTNTRMGEFWDFARGDFKAPSQEEFVNDPVSVLGKGLGYKEGELAALIKRGISNPRMQPETDLYVTHPSSGQRQRFVERTATPVRDEDGKFIGMLLVFRDVTEQKELEETRQNLTSMIVHELRSPLQAVMGSMKLITEVAPDEDPIIEQATDVSRRAVKKLLNLVNNLLDLSRMEHGEIVLDPALEQVAPIIEDPAQEVMPLARESGSVINTQVTEDLPYVKVDRDMVERVVLNLLDNALKYTEPGSLVTVSAQLRKADDKIREDMVKVSVADNGPGVPDEFKEAIFDRFSQIPGRKGRRRSAGLGLAFCKLAVESHGGRIWVTDNPEGGSIFHFVLPIAEAPPEIHDEDEEPLPAKKQLEAPKPAEDKPESDSKEKPEGKAKTAAQDEVKEAEKASSD